jgi:hypothetical protein
LLSADGRHVAFVSDASKLVPGDINGASDVFVRGGADCRIDDLPTLHRRNKKPHCIPRA